MSHLYIDRRGEISYYAPEDDDSDARTRRNLRRFLYRDEWRVNMSRLMKGLLLLAICAGCSGDGSTLGPDGRPADERTRAVPTSQQRGGGYARERVTGAGGEAGGGRRPRPGGEEGGVRALTFCVRSTCTNDATNTCHQGSPRFFYMKPPPPSRF